MSADQLLSLMVNVDMKEVAQAQAVFGVVANIVDGGSSGDDTPYKNIYPEDSSGAGSSTTESSTDASGDNSTEQPAEATQTQTTAASAKKELLTLLEVVNKMVDVTKLQPILSVQEVDIRLEGAAVTGDILSTKSRFARPWADLLADPNFEGAHKTRDRYLDFLTYLTERRTVVGARNDENEVNKIISTSNQVNGKFILLSCCCCCCCFWFPVDCCCCCCCCCFCFCFCRLLLSLLLLLYLLAAVEAVVSFFSTCCCCSCILLLLQLLL